MKPRGVSYSYIVLIPMMSAVIVAAHSMEYFTSKLLPMLIAALILLLAAIGLVREVRQGVRPGRGTPAKAPGGGEDSPGWSGYLPMSGWILGFLAGIYLLGFVAAVLILVFSYLKVHGMRAPTCVLYALAATAVTYALFGVALKIHLYPGLLRTLLLG